jgi:hypothetical protein
MFVTKGMANLNYGIFVKISKNYYFNCESWVNPQHLQFFEFIGKLFSLSIVHERFLIRSSFSILLIRMLLGEKILVRGIGNEFDEGEVIRNIEMMREYNDDSLFCVTFVF